MSDPREGGERAVELRPSERPPPRNRRVRPVAEPELVEPEPVPVSVRRSWGSPTLRRRLLRVAHALAALVALGALGLVAMEARRYALDAPAFALTTLAVDGAERLGEPEILGAAGLALGDNVFARTPEEVRADLEAHPWIAEARVERRLPGTFRIAVVERHPVALLLSGEGYLVGDDASLFKLWEPGDPADLPLVTGVDRSRFAGDRPYRTSVLTELVALTHDYRAAGLWRRLPIQELHVEANGHLSLYAGEGPLYVRLGPAPHGEKLRRLRRVLDRLDEGELEAAYVYLDNVRRPDRVTVRLREVPAPPPAAPEARSSAPG
ncbi:MAG: FtsQ-type POTRA domain-containing protein [Myxococcota bacterium]